MLDFVVYHQGETEYRVRRGAASGALVRVMWAQPRWYETLRARGSRGPLHDQMVDEMVRRAGTVTMDGGKPVDWQVLQAVRNRLWTVQRVWTDMAAKELVAAVLVDGQWVRLADHDVPGYWEAAQPMTARELEAAIL